MLAMAGVDLRRGRLVVSSDSCTVDGLWVANGAFDILPADVPDRVLGEAASRMLDASGEGIPTPDLRHGPSPFAPVLTALGLRSYAAYARGALHVDLEQHDGTVVVSPSRNGGSREGFVGRADQSLTAKAGDSGALGTAVRVALGLST
ncbi:hypothetical protein N865_08260 [Intrasporangium oryzae NRRL B-24470]|uniref:Uncharacterized protein n=1 Tax=Intrasporangium oryzae NRRL B-24470 TaxID=1386089 RepID=W9GDA3_9MICO|nr:hypothetical protein [Intrasporangium oryzae]EWT01849.1 hypothetical protein N865_08260 [Intrasporangium oryzae NRRL B-24470]